MKEKDNYSEFIKQTAEDYDLDITFVQDAYNERGDSFYGALEDEIEKRREEE